MPKIQTLTVIINDGISEIVISYPDLRIHTLQIFCCNFYINFESEFLNNLFVNLFKGLYLYIFIEYFKNLFSLPIYLIIFR